MSDYWARAEEFTPTDEYMRRTYINAQGPEGRTGPEFDRWLAAHDAEVLRAAALSGDFGATAQSTLLRHAERIEKEAAA